MDSGELAGAGTAGSLVFSLEDFGMPSFETEHRIFETFAPENANADGFVSERIGNVLGAFNVDYRYVFGFGFDFDFTVSGSSTSIFTNLDYTLNIPSAVVAGTTFEIDTSEFFFGSTIVTSRSPSINLDLDILTQFDLEFRNESLEAFGGLSSVDLEGILPDISDTGIVSTDFLDYSSADPLPPIEFSGLGVDVTLMAPTNFTALGIGEPSSTIVTAQGNSNSIISADFDLLDALSTLAPPIVALIRNNINPSLEFINDETGEVEDQIDFGRFSYSLLEFAVELNLELVQETIFTRTGVQVTVTNETTGEVTTGALGSVLELSASELLTDNNLTVDFELTGEIVTRFGIQPVINLPFEVLQLTSEFSGRDPVTFGPALEDAFRFATDPIFFHTSEPVAVTLEAPPISYILDVINADGNSEGIIINNGEANTTSLLPQRDPIVSDVTVSEVDEGDDLTFTIFLDNAVNQASSIDFVISLLTAEASDITIFNGTLNFEIGSTSATLTVPTIEDVDINDESIALILQSASGISLGNNRSTTAFIRDTTETIIDERPILSRVINDTVFEGGDLEFEVQLDRAATRDVTLFYTLTPEVNAENFTAINGELTISAGESAGTIVVNTDLDNDALNGLVRLNITSADGVVLAEDVSASGTIRDNFVPAQNMPRVQSVSDASVLEGGVLEFLVTLDGPARNDVVLFFGLEAEGLGANRFFNPIGGFELDIRRGESTGLIRVQTTPDRDSFSEEVTLTINNAIGLENFSPITATGTIIDNSTPDLPIISITPSDATEGSAVRFTFDIIGANPRNDEITVNFRIEGGSATEGVDFDTDNTLHVITLRRDSESRFFNVNTTTDGRVEENETINLIVESIEGGVTNDLEVSATIIDDDVVGQRIPLYLNRLSITGSVDGSAEGATITYGLAGAFQNISSPQSVEFRTEGLSADRVESITVIDFQRNSFGDFQRVTTTTSDFSAGGGDFAFARIQIAPAVSALGRDIRFIVNLKDDDIYHEDTTFSVVPVTFEGGEVIFDTRFEGFSRVRLIDNDTPPPPLVSVGSDSEVEGGVIEIPVTLERAALVDTVIAYEVTFDRFSTASEDDFSSLTGTVTIAAGATTGNIQIQTQQDNRLESAERFNVSLTSVIEGEAAINSANVGVGTIAQDNDTVFIGNEEDDFITGSVNADQISGAGGDDFFLGGFGADQLNGGDGNDTLSGGEGADELQGGSGNDILRGENGDDRIDGGDGIDEVSFITSEVGVVLNLNTQQGQAQDTGAGLDTLLNIENAAGSNFADMIQGNNQDNAIFGNDGDDMILAGNAVRLTDVEGQVYRAFQAVFDRDPDLAGFNAFRQEIRLGNLTQEDVIAEFVESAEFQQTFGALDNGAFLDQLFLNVFNRPADAGGRAAFLAALEGGRSRASVVTEFANSAEFQQTTSLSGAAFATNVIFDPIEGQVFRIFQAVFDRTPDAGGRAFVAEIQAGIQTLEDAVNEFIVSAEFQLTYGDLDNKAFVETLFTNVLPENMDTVGREAFTVALDNGNLTRAEIVQEFSESQEFRNNTDADVVAYLQTLSEIDSDVIQGGEGNDVLFGGTGRDTFIFDTNDDGADIILDFEAGDAGSDVLNILFNEDFDSFAEVLAVTNQIGANTFIDFGDGNSITLNNVNMSDLSADDFVFEEDILF